MGIDLGYGGDSINDTAITMDQKQMYTNFGKKAQNLYGDARNLYWFTEDALDFVYSSHLIEDFEDIKSILYEWIRVIHPNGFLCLLFPDEKRYREMTPQEYWNMSHKHMEMGLSYMINIISQIPNLSIIESRELFDNNDYSCMIVCRKV
jgi:ubiquinone/menaquinone biosynthesis C-methylase UbiE